MKKTLRMIIAIVVALSMVAALAACGVKQETKPPASETTQQASTETASETKKEPVTISIMTFEFWGSNEPALTAGITAYEKATGNKVDLKTYPNDQFDNVVKTKVAMDDVTDVIAYHSTKSSLPEKAVEVLDGPWMSKLNPEGIKYAYGRESDGKVVVVPYGNVEYLGVIYNKKVFEKAGITAPIKSYKELMDACEAIKKQGVVPVVLGNKEPHIAQIFSLIGSGYLYENKPEVVESITKNKAKPQDIPEVADMFKRIYALKEKGYINGNYMSMTSTEAAKFVAEGKGAMTFLSDWFYGEVKKTMPDKVAETGMMPGTFGDDYLDTNKGFGGRGLWLPVAAKNKEAGKEFIDFMLSDEGIKAVSDAQPGPSPFVGVQTSMNEWQQEMSGYESTYPAKGGWARLFPNGLGNEYAQMWQAYFAGKPLNDTLQSWYSDYSKIYKAKGIEGWK